MQRQRTKGQEHFDLYLYPRWNNLLFLEGNSGLDRYRGDNICRVSGLGFALKIYRETERTVNPDKQKTASR
jgi:hypothetical protein